MKKLAMYCVLAILFATGVNAQNGADKIIEEAKNGEFKFGASIGAPQTSVSSFNLEFNASYLFEVMDNLEVGAVTGLTHFFGKNYHGYKVEDATFMPISTTARYYFADKKFFGGLDLGFAIKLAGNDDLNSGLYLRPKFGYNLGKITLIASYQAIGGGIDGPRGSVGGHYGEKYRSVNAGVEISF